MEEVKRIYADIDEDTSAFRKEVACPKGGAYCCPICMSAPERNNEAILPEQISSMFGAEQISEFASKLGLSNEEAAGGLSKALPQMVDKASRGGSLLDSIGGIQGAIGVASKLFGN